MPSIAYMARIGRRHVGICLSPFGRLHELGDFPGENETFLQLAGELVHRDIAYVHLMDQASRGAPAMPAGFLERFRGAYRGTLILAGGLDLAKPNDRLACGVVDLAAFGVPFIANPDLVERLRHGWPLAAGNRDAYYRDSAEGYTDCPFHVEAVT